MSFGLNQTEYKLNQTEYKLNKSNFSHTVPTGKFQKVE